MIEDLFIPPSGAMQFVVAGFPDHFMWVGQPVARGRADHNIPEGCKCAVTWPVINGVDFEPSQPLRGKWCICACRGRIIE